MPNLPKYTEFDLLQILQHDPHFPFNGKENSYEKDIVNNSKISWQLNPFLFKLNNLRLLVSGSFFKLWRNIKSLNWIIVLFIISFTIIHHDYKLLLLLITFPLLTALGILDSRIILLNIIIILGTKYFLHLEYHYFWLLFDVVSALWLTNKIIQRVIRSIIIKKVFTNFTTFWQYFSNKLIYIDRLPSDAEYKRLIAAYPELKKYCC